jgi:cellulose synthase/poly-beta-1,6-N-acetylglucosamine synthase-like glycosyltransferase
LSEITAEFVTGDSAPSGQTNLNEHSTLSVMRRSTPVVSVVVDTYNHEAFISDAIIIVLQQEYQLGPVEVLVVDDGSQDGNRERAYE